MKTKKTKTSGTTKLTPEMKARIMSAIRRTAETIESDLARSFEEQGKRMTLADLADCSIEYLDMYGGDKEAHDAMFNLPITIQTRLSRSAIR